MTFSPTVTFQVPEGGQLERELRRYAPQLPGSEAEHVAIEPIAVDDSGQIDIGGSGGVIVMTIPSLADLPRQRPEIIDALMTASEETGPLVIGVESGAALGEEHLRAALDAASAADRDLIIAVRDDA